MFDNNPITITTALQNSAIPVNCNPDPYMIRHNGRYYCYSSGTGGVNVLQSEDLETFEHMGFAMTDAGWTSYWAPSVFFYNGLFYMYYSSIPTGETDDHRHYLQVAAAKHPLGPFTYQKTLYQEFSIDPHVIEKNGKLYLFYSANRAECDVQTHARIGTVILLDQLLDPLTPMGQPRVIVEPSMDQEIFAKNRFGDGRDWHTIEGAFYFEQDDTGYLLYSGNAYTHEDYFVGYAVCDVSLPLEGAVFTKYPDAETYHPLAGKDTLFTGCGHCSVTIGTQGERLMIYHGRPRSQTEVLSAQDDGRRLCICEIKTEGGGSPYAGEVEVKRR